MTFLPQDMAMVKRLVVKDWQVYQKQLAGYVAGLLLALSLMGMAKPWSFSAGALLTMRDRWRPATSTAPTTTEAAPA